MALGLLRKYPTRLRTLQQSDELPAQKGDRCPHWETAGPGHGSRITCLSPHLWPLETQPSVCSPSALTTALLPSSLSHTWPLYPPDRPNTDPSLPSAWWSPSQEGLMGAGFEHCFLLGPQLTRPSSLQSPQSQGSPPRSPSRPHVAGAADLSPVRLNPPPTGLYAP